MQRGSKVRLACSLILLAIVGCSGFAMWAYHGRVVAKRHSDAGAWKECRSALQRYLWIRPSDAEAQLLMAEAYVRDLALPVEHAVQQATDCLHQIPDDAPLGAEARAKEARVRFLVLLEPYTAETLFRRSLELDPKSEENWYLLWKLLELTGRSDEAAEVFWRMYESTPATRRAAHLRELYMAQFFPLTASSQWDRDLGFLDEGEEPQPATEHKRLLAFRDREPSSAIAQAALARWFHLQGDPAFALKLLNKRDSLESPFDSPQYVGTLVAVLFDLGELDAAGEHLQKWPGPHDGYQYWKLRGMLSEELSRDDDKAVKSYEAALAFWPGPVDWRTRSRMSHCMDRQSQHEDARATREAVRLIQRQLEDKVHERLRIVLNDLRDAEQLSEIVEFYRSLGCSREVQGWSEHIDRLKKEGAEQQRKWNSGRETIGIPFLQGRRVAAPVE